MKISEHPGKGLREEVSQLRDEVSKLKAELRDLSLKMQQAELNDELTSKAVLMVLRTQQEILDSLHKITHNLADLIKE